MQRPAKISPTVPADFWKIDVCNTYAASLHRVRLSVVALTAGAPHRCWPGCSIQPRQVLPLFLRRQNDTVWVARITLLRQRKLTVLVGGGSHHDARPPERGVSHGRLIAGLDRGCAPRGRSRLQGIHPSEKGGASCCPSRLGMGKWVLTGVRCAGACLEPHPTKQYVVRGREALWGGSRLRIWGASLGARVLGQSCCSACASVIGVFCSHPTSTCLPDPEEER